MKKQKLSSVIILIGTLIFINISVFAELSDTIYTDEESNISFSIPVGWTETKIDEVKNTDVMFKNDEDSTALISYLSTDLWNIYTEEERQNLIDAGYSRSDIDNTIFPVDEYISEFEDSNTTVQTYNGHEFYVVTIKYAQELYGNSVSIPVTQLITVYNGYMHIFQFMGNSEAALYPDFIELVNSVNFGLTQNMFNPTPPPEQPTYSPPIPYTEEPTIPWHSVIVNILFGFILTVTIYSLPIIIYRYFINKSPISPKSAIKVTIVYAIISGLIMMFVKIVILKGSGSLTAIWLWSIINYSILTSGYKKKITYFIDENPEDSEEPQAIISDEQSKYIPCHVFTKDGTVKDSRINADNIKFDYAKYLHDGELYFHEKEQDGKYQNIIITKEKYDNITSTQTTESK